MINKCGWISEWIPKTECKQCMYVHNQCSTINLETLNDIYAFINIYIYELGRELRRGGWEFVYTLVWRT